MFFSSWRLRVLLGVCVLLGGGLLYLLFQATANTSLFAENYTMLLLLGATLALGLLGLIGYQIRMLYRRLRSREFGSRLTLRLLIVFSVAALVPGTLVYAVSVQFLANSIETWFNVNVDQALEAGLNLGRTSLDSMLDDLALKGESMAGSMAESTAIDEVPLLNHLREQAGVDEVTLYNKTGKTLAFSSSHPTALFPGAGLPNAAALRQIRLQRIYKSIESVPGQGFFLRVVVPVNLLSINEDMRALELLQPVPAELSANAERVDSAWRNYQELIRARVGLKRVYGLTLTLTLLLTLLSALALAFSLSEYLGRALGQLSETALAVGRGDFTRFAKVSSKDELGLLAGAFNTMIRQLQSAAETRARDQAQVEEAKSHLEGILAHLSAGVIVINSDNTIEAANPAANHHLKADTFFVIGAQLETMRTDAPIEGMRAFAGAILQHFAQATESSWDSQLEYVAPDGVSILRLRGSSLPGKTPSDRMVVFDDITELLQAQRDAAWGEVARRLAHEIKNPLTPIQLAAEHLQRKLISRLNEEDVAFVNRSTATIVNQVDAMKLMVDDFSAYARASGLVLRSLDLNALIGEVATLYEPMQISIRLDLMPNIPRFMGDSKLLRQVLHNLMQNATDVLQDQANPEIMISTKVESGELYLTISDNGLGISENLLGRVFEPYVTGKIKGTGLGLAIVKKIVEEHQGRIQVRNQEPQGAQFVIILPLGGNESDEVKA
jgi:nitrogen fixation/metabolism regulation signal transduction histidine kinase